jgi:acetyl esterase/lipase
MQPFRLRTFAAACAFLLACLFQAPIVHAAGAPDASNITFTRNVVYGTGGGRPLHMHVANPKTPQAQPMPVLIYIHGGGWSGGSLDQGVGFVNYFAQHGYVAATIEYRLSGEAKFPAQIEDCKCAVRFFRAHAAEYHIDPERIGVMGDSAGGHLAALLGVSAGAKDLEGSGGWPDFPSKVEAVCDWYGPVDFSKDVETGNAEMNRAINGYVAALFGGTPQKKPDLAKSATPLTYITKDAPPFLIMHGDKDPVVPLFHSQELADALKAAGVDVTLQIIPNAGHGTREFFAAEILEAVTAFFDAKLARK